jgi:Nickel responsive protein SCO4226-like
MPVFVVEEKFDPPVDVSKVNPNAEKLSPCLPTYEVKWIASFLAEDGSRCVCVYEASSGDAVRQLYRTAGVPFTSVWPANHMKA